MRICILGAGYAGLTLARELDRWLGPNTPHEILLIDRSSHHQLITRLHEVAAAAIPPDAALVPLSRALRGSRVHFHQATVTAIDPVAKRAHCDGREFGFDILVMALGGEAAESDLPGIAENALSLRNCDQAVRLARHIERQVVRARRAPDAAIREAHLTAVIIGGGCTGVELAGELHDRLRDLVALHELSESPRLLLIESRDQLLPGFPLNAAYRAQEILAQLGVEVRVLSPVSAVRPGQVTLASGERIAAGTIAWVGGTRAPRLLAESGLATDHRGRACVDAYLCWSDRSDLFAIGDACHLLDHDAGAPVPATAQHAIQQARHLAYSLYRLLQGRPLVRYQPAPIAEILSLGRHHAIAVLGPVVLAGREARVLKHLSYRRYESSIRA
ncbi:MAG TPA: NAD(P)/FAD-dependent oxidoreductase [Armatimonadetes bacterium]|nr:NAD(P)/FAD-dependent oxidoreductase [Armatimonadota bacterium]